MDRAIIGALLLFGVAACGEPSGPGEIIRREETVVQPGASVQVGAGPEMRHYGTGSAQGGGAMTAPGSAPQAGAGASGLAALVDYDLPEGWEVLEGSQFRLINLRPAGDPDAEFYISVLPNSGGGVVDNVNRWRDQVGLGPIDESAVAALPRRRLLGVEGVLVDVEGTFTGMGTEAKPGWRLIGLVVPIQGQTLFVKMTGPASLLAQERGGFDTFCDSVRPSAYAAKLQAQEEAQLQGGAPGSGGGGLAWSAPAGWVDQGPRTMRLVSYQLPGGTECYLALARGDRLSNYNRWAGQIGAEPMTAADLEGLKTIEVLGEGCPLLELTGEFLGMVGGPQAATTLLATMRPLDGDSLFIKMVGPAAEVAAARVDFEAFCASIENE